MDIPTLKNRTRKFAATILVFVDQMPNRKSASIIANQLGRSASSVAANYRAACRARSKAEFIAKIGIVEEEADETAFWLELLIDTKNTSPEIISHLLNEANELTAIFTATGKTAKKNNVKS